jgi:hypothetical protein
MPQAARNIYVSAASADAGDAELLHLRAEYHRIRAAAAELPDDAIEQFCLCAGIAAMWELR